MILVSGLVIGSHYAHVHVTLLAIPFLTTHSLQLLATIRHLLGLAMPHTPIPILALPAASLPLIRSHKQILRQHLLLLLLFHRIRHFFPPLPLRVTCMPDTPTPLTPTLITGASKRPLSSILPPTLGLSADFPPLNPSALVFIFVVGIHLCVCN